MALVRRLRAASHTEKNIMLARKALILMLLLPYGASRSQSRAPQTPQPARSFEVATLREAMGSDGSDGSWSPPGIGHFTAHRLTLAFLIHLAYDIDTKQIVAKPSWLETDLFDIEAKPEAGIPLTREQLRPMLQTLLQERLHLAVHHETRPGPGFVLMVAKGGPKLQPTKGDRFPGYRIHVDSGNLQGVNWSMPYLASMLQAPSGRPVLDKTGIQGSFDIHLRFAPESAPESSLPSLFTALHDTLGLELKPQQIPIDVLVIDEADRVPSEN